MLIGKAAEAIVAAALGGCSRHNRTDPRDRRVGVARHEPQDGIRRRVGQARHRAEDARNADLRRFRRVEIVRPRGGALRRIRDESLASRRSVWPILWAPATDKDAQRDEWTHVRLKANTMSFRPTTFVVVTTGLIAAAGLCGCQVPRTLRSLELRSLPWRRTQEPLPRDTQDLGTSETYIPEAVDRPSPIPRPTFPQQTIPNQPNLRLPDEPAFPPDPASDLRPIPVPPAVEVDAPQARRWKPAPPQRSAAQGPQYSSQSESTSQDFDLPPARVTYNTETSTAEPGIPPAPEHNRESHHSESQHSAAQPRLFRPAGSAKNMFDTMKRKLSR